jgi:hypothetical protein
MHQATLDQRIAEEEVRVREAEDQALKLATYRNDQLKFKKIQIELEPIKIQLSQNADLLRSASPDQIPWLEDQRKGLYGEMKRVVGGIDSQGAQTALDVPAPVDYEPPPVEVSDDPVLSVYQGMANVRRNTEINDLIKSYWSMAGEGKDQFEVAVGNIKSESGGLSSEEDKHVRDALGKSVTLKYTFYPDDGIKVDQKGNVTKLKGSPMFGEMTKSQSDEANYIGSRWSADTRLSRMWGMAMLTHGAGYAGYKSQNSPGDIALLYSLAKMVAPDDSAVREGEFKSMAQAMGWVETSLLLPRRLFSGEQLNPEGRREIWMLIDEIKRSRMAALAEHSMNYADMATKRGLKPEWAIPGWKEMDPAGVGARSTGQLLVEMDQMLHGIGTAAKEPMGDEARAKALEIQKELRRRFGVLPGQTIEEARNWWLTQREDARKWWREAKGRGARIQQAAEASMNAPVNEVEAP